MPPIGPPVAHSVIDMPNTRPSQRSWKAGSPGSGATAPNPCMPPMSWMPSTAARLPRMSDADDLADLLLELAAFYLVEARRSGAFGLGELTGGRVRAFPLAPDEAHHDPPLLPGTAAVRAWYPVEGVPEACIELRLSPS